MFERDVARRRYSKVRLYTAGTILHIAKIKPVYKDKRQKKWVVVSFFQKQIIDIFFFLQETKEEREKIRDEVVTARGIYGIVGDAEDAGGSSAGESGIRIEDIVEATGGLASHNWAQVL